MEKRRACSRTGMPPGASRAWRVAPRASHPAWMCVRLVTTLFTGCLALVAGIAFAAPAPRLARSQTLANGTVTYVERDYTVNIQSDGSVRVSETWDVRFTGGPFTHAFLALYTAGTKSISFGTVTGADAGSQQISSTTDSAGNTQEEVSWNFPATTDGERTFTIPYTLTGALGVGTDVAWFDWHFLDGGSTTGMPVQQSKIAIAIPQAGANNEQAYTASAGGTVTTNVTSGQPVQVTGTDLTSNQPLEVEVVFPRSALDASVQAPSWQVGEMPPTPPTPLQVATNPNSGGDTSPNGGGYDPGGSDSSTSNGFWDGVSTVFQGLFSGVVCLGMAFLILFFFFVQARGSARAGRGTFPGWWNRWGGPRGGGPWMGGGGGGSGGGGGGASGFS